MVTSHFAATPQSDVVRLCAHDFQRHGDAFGTTENACFRAFMTIRSKSHLHHCSQRTLTEIVSKITPNLGLVLLNPVATTAAAAAATALLHPGRMRL